MNLIDTLRDLLTPAPRPDPVPLDVPAELTVFGEMWCGDCRRARKHLDAAGVSYAWVDLAFDGVAKARLRAAGLRAIPVIATADGRVVMEPSNAELRALVASLD